MLIIFVVLVIMNYVIMWSSLVNSNVEIKFMINNKINFNFFLIIIIKVLLLRLDFC